MHIFSKITKEQRELFAQKLNNDNHLQKQLHDFNVEHSI